MSDKLYNSHSLEKTSSEVSGSLTIWQDAPVSPYDIGDTFSPIEGVTLNVKKVNISDNVIGDVNGKPFRLWQIAIEGSSEEVGGDSDTNIKYNFSVSADETSGSMEVTNKGNAPTLTLEIGDDFNVPGLGSVKCTSIKASNSYNENGVQTWNVIYEGVTSSGDSSSGSTSDSDETVTYELNGVTVRTVAGEFIALRRSQTPIKKGSYTVVNNSDSPLTSPGGDYKQMTVTSETIVKEITKTNGVVTKTQYKHTIEVES